MATFALLGEYQLFLDRLAPDAACNVPAGTAPQAHRSLKRFNGCYGALAGNHLADLFRFVVGKRGNGTLACL